MIDPRLSLFLIAVSASLATAAPEFIFPEDARFALQRLDWNQLRQTQPAAIALCSTVADVQAALAFARSRNLQVVTRSGRHSYWALSADTGKLVVDLGAMRKVDVDPSLGRMTVQPGARLFSLHAAAAANGFVSVRLSATQQREYFF